MELNKTAQEDTFIIINNMTYYSEYYVKLQMNREYERGYSEACKSNEFIHRAEIIECTNCSNKSYKQD
jgi:hypothetical protein